MSASPLPEGIDIRPLHRPRWARQPPRRSLRLTAALALVSLGLALAAFAEPAAGPVPRAIGQSREEFPGLPEFAARFDAEAGSPRIVMILSPT